MVSRNAVLVLVLDEFQYFVDDAGKGSIRNGLLVIIQMEDVPDVFQVTLSPLSGYLLEKGAVFSRFYDGMGPIEYSYSQEARGRKKISPCIR